MTLTDVLLQADKELQESIKRELRDEGHHLTGRLEQSIKGTVKEQVRSATLTGTALHYAGILNAGVKPARIPFGTHTGAGHSKYIEALINYWKLRGLDDTEAKKAAFATARKQKQEGMPTAASAKHSTTGNRLDFLGVVDKAISDTLQSKVFGGIDQMITDAFHETKNERI